MARSDVIDKINPIISITAAFYKKKKKNIDALYIITTFCDIS